MPESIDIYSTDKFIYRLIKDSNESLCHIDPNFVTLSNILLSFYIAYCLLYQRDVKWLYFLVILRSVLDILDGGVARKCNKQSEVGKYLDNIGDLIFFLVLCYIVIIRIKKKYRLIKQLIPFLVVIAIYITYKNCTTDYDITNRYWILRIIHDNTIIVGIVTMYGLLNILN